MVLSLIAALSQNHIIGKSNQLPWHLPADLKHFKELTTNKSIIMGRKTFESIGKALPDRRNIVVTRQNDYIMNNIEVYTSIDAALAATATEPEVMVIGGAELYKQTIDRANRLYLTLVDTVIADGDAYFPQWDPTGWTRIHEEKHTQDERNAFGYTFLTLDRSKKR